jgi:hypothetical protein
MNAVPTVFVKISNYKKSPCLPLDKMKSAQAKQVSMYIIQRYKN